MNANQDVDFRILVPGQRFRTLGPFGEVSPIVRTFVTCSPAGRRGYYVIRTEACGPGCSDRITMRATQKVRLEPKS